LEGVGGRCSDTWYRDAMARTKQDDAIDAAGGSLYLGECRAGDGG
jgi:hypothetical protein